MTLKEDEKTETPESVSGPCSGPPRDSMTLHKMRRLKAVTYWEAEPDARNQIGFDDSTEDEKTESLMRWRGLASPQQRFDDSTEDEKTETRGRFCSGGFRCFFGFDDSTQDEKTESSLRLYHP